MYGRVLEKGPCDASSREGHTSAKKREGIRKERLGLMAESAVRDERRVFPGDGTRRGARASSHKEKKGEGNRKGNITCRLRKHVYS